MAVAFRAKTNAALNSSGTGPVTVTVPAGVVDGDALLTVLVLNTQVTITVPSGWTQLGSNGDDGTTFRSALYWRTAASEPVSYDWSFGAATKACISCLAWSGADGTAPFYAQVFQNETGTATAHVSGTCVLTGSGTDRLIAVGADRDSTNPATTWTNSDGSDVQRDTLFNTGSSAGSYGIYDSNRDLASGNHTRTLTSSVSTSNAGVWLVGVKVADVPPAVTLPLVVMVRAAP